MTTAKVANALSAFEDISLPGIKSLTDRRQPIWAKIIWSLVFLICTGLCIFQVVERIEHFFEYPVNLMYELKHLEFQKIPKITLCTNDNFRIKNILSNTESQKNSENGDGSYTSSASNSINNAIVWNATGNSLPDIVSECKYFGDKSCMKMEFWYELMSSSGRCYTLDVGNSFDDGGISIGFRITMKMPSGTRLSDHLTWKVLLHDDENDALYETLINSIPLIQSTLTTVIFTYKQFVFQNVPNRHCINKQAVADCQLKCSDQYFLQKYKCRLPFMKTVMLPPCDPDIEMADAEYLAYYYDMSTCKCPKACVDESFDFQVDTRKNVDTVLKIYQGREEMEVFEEKRAYVLYALICEVGGILGLYLGACLLTFVEICDVLLLVCCRRLASRSGAQPIMPKSMQIKRATVGYIEDTRY